MEKVKERSKPRWTRQMWKISKQSKGDRAKGMEKGNRNGKGRWKRKAKE